MIGAALCFGLMLAAVAPLVLIVVDAWNRGGR